MISSTISTAGFGATTAIALIMTMAAAGESRAAYRIAGVVGPVRPAMKPLSTGTGVAGPAAQVPPRIALPSPAIATERAGDQGRERNAPVAGVTASVIVAGVPSGYYYGPRTYYAPGYYGGQYSDGGPAVGPSPLADNGASCTQTYSSTDPHSPTYIGSDGDPHPCP
jgi:hypothetical protein